MTPHTNRLAALRAQLKADQLDGFVIPISDEHMSEYVGAYAQRLAWLTGFGGSAGTAVVLHDQAVIFVDGRYTLQVREQVSGADWDYQSVPETSISDWLLDQSKWGARIGFDPWLHTKGWVEAVQKKLADKKAALVAVERNPVDAVWLDRPVPSLAAMIVHPDQFSGQSSADKRATVADWLCKEGLDTVVVSALDSVAWLLNIRGSDVDRTPVALSFVLAHKDGTADLYVAPKKVDEAVRAHLGSVIRIHPPEEFVPALKALKDNKVAVDPERSVAAIFAALEMSGAEIVEIRDPTILPKAIKNTIEQAGHRAAQKRDGVALSRFLHWLSVEAPKGGVTELSAAEKLRAYREETGLLRDLSFDTISGAGPNGAVVHYRVSPKTNRTLEPSSMYLVDSGGQYLDGTTDVTRTVWIGPGDPTDEMKDRFTRVLKGHIALARATFPVGTKGSQLDALARQYLWAAGVDYAHGTGHGVGSYLAVHEGPQRIANRAPVNEESLHAGMIVSNEPGYYKTGEYGIRIENLVLVEPREIDSTEGDYLGFETLTFAPIDRALVETSLMTRDELRWFDAYHAEVIDKIGPQLTGGAREWLTAVCAPLDQH
jgi:Xaa-Pro aminopeptidase